MNTIDLMLEILAAALLLTGGIVMAVAALGVARLPDVFMRMHAATKAGVVGTGLILLGSGIALETGMGLALAVAGVVFLIATTPIASHAIGRAAYVAGTPLADTLVSDALAGRQRRHRHDLALSPGSSGGQDITPRKEESVMASALVQRQMLPHAFTEQMALRSITVWLAGGPSNREAIRFGLDLAEASGARLTGLSAFDPADSVPPGPVPLGGTHWNKWLADSRRGRMRAVASAALAEFQGLTKDGPAGVTCRHEEGALEQVVVATAGADLLIAPAGVDPYGAPAQGEAEFAHVLARRRLGPLLRVRERPDSVHRIALIAADPASCGRLAQGLLATGLWPQAAVTVVPLLSEGSAALALAREQVEQLLAHGRKAKLGEPIDDAAGAEVLRNRFSSYYALVLSSLARPSTGWRAMLRDDPVERIAAQVPLALLP